MRRLLATAPFLFAACLAGLALFMTPALAVQTGFTPADLYRPGIYKAEGDFLVSVGAGRISQTLGEARRERLAGELALRNARRQLAAHLYKDKLDVPGKYTVHIEGARVIRREKRGDTVYVALLADPAAITLVARHPLEDFQGVAVAPLVEELLGRAPLLAEGGGSVFDLGEGWVGLGVGYAALPEQPSAQDIRQARTIARIAAAEALTGFVFGIQVNARSEQHELYANGPGGERFKEWAKNSLREEITGTLNGAQLAGEWFTDDSHIGVAVLVGIPPVDIGSGGQGGAADSPGADEPEEPLLHKSDLPLEWQRNIAARAWILDGGVTVCRNENTLYVLAVESGALRGNAAHDRMQLPTIIDAKARNQITRYLIGFSSNTVTRSEEIRRADLTGEEFTESLNKISREGVAGVVAGIKLLGSWYSEDEKTLFQAFVVPLP